MGNCLGAQNPIDEDLRKKIEDVCVRSLKNLPSEFKSAKRDIVSEMKAKKPEEVVIEGFKLKYGETNDSEVNKVAFKRAAGDSLKDSIKKEVKKETDPEIDRKLSDMNSAVRKAARSAADKTIGSIVDKSIDKAIEKIQEEIEKDPKSYEVDAE